MNNGGMNKQLQIFKAGKHTAMSGVALAFSEADIAATVAAYDPSKHEAPLVIGHPKTDDPAFGWVKSLQFSDGVLQAEPDQVDAAFAELVNDGKFKKISASFYTPDAPNNPVPGVYYLRHVGFLGAQAPAVKGLKAASFADAEEGVVEFADWDQMTIAGLFSRLREWIISKDGIEAADKALPSYEIQSIQISAVQETTSSETQYSEPNSNQGDEMSVEDQATLAAALAENATLKKQQADFAETQDKARRDAAHTDNVAFAEGLVKSGQLLPAQKDAVIATLDALTNPAQALEFGEGEAKQPLAAALKEALTANPKAVEFGEHKGSDQHVPDISEDADAIAAKAVAFAESEAAAGRAVNAAQAVAHVISSISK